MKNAKQFEKFVRRIGFEVSDKEHPFFATGPIRNSDMDCIKKLMGKNHFIPNGYRGVFLGEAVDGFYVTSHIRGTYRGYRCRNETPDHDTANIFGHGKTQKEALENFIQNYNKNSFNIC